MNQNYILIIDDDVWMQRILSKTLESFGFQTLLASNGYEGIALAVEHIPKCVILDILMPELNGHQTLKILKYIKKTKQIPVLMLSAMSDSENLGLAVKAGIAGFISKPFTRATIFDKLANVFGKEMLDSIAKGRDAEMLIDIPVSSTDQASKSAVSAMGYKQDMPKSDSNKPQLQNEQVLQHYQEDEKRSIESIKKLLLKTKK